MSVKCRIRINDKEIMAIVDSGAATNIMTSKLQKELGIKIIDKSNAVFTIANGKRVAALGKAKVKISIAGKMIKVEVQIIESEKRDFLFGTRMLARSEGVIDFGNKELRMKLGNEEIAVPIYFEKRVEFEEEYREESENENENEYEEIIEQELYEEESEEYDSEEYEKYDKSSAYYLAELI